MLIMPFVLSDSRSRIPSTCLKHLTGQPAAVPRPTPVQCFKGDICTGARSQRAMWEAFTLSQNYRLVGGGRCVGGSTIQD